jgi:hypothetical protein
VDVNGNLILYCRTPATNSRDGVYTQGTNSDATSPTVGASCSVDVPGGEGAQVLSQPSYEGGWEGGPETVEVFPIAFWTGTEHAVFQVQTEYFLWGGVSDTPQTALDADWSAASPYGPAPPSAQPGSGLSTSAMITSGLQNQTVEVWLTTAAPGVWEHGTDGDWVCDGPILDVSLLTEPDTTPSSEAPPTQASWTVPSQAEAVASLSAVAGQVQTSAPDDYVVFAPTCFWISPQPASPPYGASVSNVLGPPDADGESIVYSYYLDISPSSTVHWDFGDGISEDAPADDSGPGNCVTHYYKQVSGEGSVPADGATVSASQDVVVTAFVGWVDAGGDGVFECVTPGGGLDGVNAGSQAAAQADCSATFPDALADTPLPPKPVYQVRTIPVA